MKFSPEELHNIKRLLLSSDQSSVALGYELAKKARIYLNELRHELVIVAMLSEDKSFRNKLRRYLGRHFSPEQFKKWKLAFEVFHKFGQYYHYYPQAEQMIKRHETIRKDFEPSFRQSAHFAEHYYELARILQYRIKRKPKLARDYYKIVTAANSQHADALFNLGHLYQTDLYDNINSEICYHQVLKLRPTMAVAYNNLGSLHSKDASRIDEAIKYFNKALKYNPNYTFYTCNLAGAYLTAKQPEKFEELIHGILSKDRTNKRAINQWANYLWEYKKDYPAAKKAYEDGLRYNPNDQFLVGNFGELYEYVYKDYLKAFEYYQRSLNASTSPYRLVLMISLLVHHLKDFAKAQEYYEVLQNEDAYQYQARDHSLTDEQWNDFLTAEKMLLEK
ncbi:MAG: hypothetical protein GY810_28180 [Aureispira sp.]|nr:hypothetical protein [Aureispira sp.]